MSPENLDSEKYRICAHNLVEAQVNNFPSNVKLVRRVVRMLQTNAIKYDITITIGDMIEILRNGRRDREESPGILDFFYVNLIWNYHLICF